MILPMLLGKCGFTGSIGLRFGQDLIWPRDHLAWLNLKPLLLIVSKKPLGQSDMGSMEEFCTRNLLLPELITGRTLIGNVAEISTGNVQCDPE